MKYPISDCSLFIVMEEWSRERRTASHAPVKQQKIIKEKTSLHRDVNELRNTNFKKFPSHRQSLMPTYKDWTGDIPNASNRITIRKAYITHRPWIWYMLRFSRNTKQGCVNPEKIHNVYSCVFFYRHMSLTIHR